MSLSEKKSSPNGILSVLISLLPWDLLKPG